MDQKRKFFVGGLVQYAYNAGMHLVQDAYNGGSLYNFQVSTCGMLLHLYVPLPDVMTDTTLLHKYCVSKPEARGGIKGYHPKISGLEKFLKKRRARKSATIVALANIALPARVETHLDEKILCTWVDHSHNVLYLTLKCASDGYAEGADCSNGLVTAQALGEGNTGVQRRDRA